MAADKSSGKSKKDESASPPPVTSSDIRDKLDELKDTAVGTVSKGGAAWTVGALFGAAAAVAAAYFAGRRSCR